MTFLCTTLCCQSETWQVGTRVSRISWNFSKSSGKKISHSIYQKKDMCKFLEFLEIIYYPPGALTFSVIWLQVLATINVTKWPYLRPEVPNPKNKATFVYSTFKVGEKNVPLFFSFEASWLRYEHFFIFIIVFHLYFRAILTIFGSGNGFYKTHFYE